MSNIEKIVTKAVGEKAQKKGETRQKFLRRLATTAQGMWFDEEEDGTAIEPTDKANDIWEQLEKDSDGEAAQQWINTVVLLLDKDDDLPDFPDIEEEAETDEAVEAEADEDGDTETETEEEEDETMLAKNEEHEDEAPAKSKKKTAKAPAKKVAAKEKPAAKVKGKNGAAPVKKVAAKDKSVKAKGKAGAPKRGSGPSGYTTIRAIMRKNMGLKLPELLEALKAKDMGHLSKNAVSVIRSNFLQTCAELDAAGCLKGLKLPG